MAQALGLHAPRLGELRDLRGSKGRRESGTFAFEGPTLLGEARRSGLPIRELYVTEQAYERLEVVREIEASGVPTWLLAERSMQSISDLDTPPGALAVADIPNANLDAMFAHPGLVLVLADVGDPGNVGTLLRAAEAFGARGVVIGNLGAEAFQPKVVRAAMGTIFRLPIARVEPDDLAAAAQRHGTVLVGLDGAGAPLPAWKRPERCAIIVGHERHGLGRWAPLCADFLAIPMPGAAESLNAAVAGGIALYAASLSAERGPIF